MLRLTELKLPLDHDKVHEACKTCHKQFKDR